MPYLWKKDFSIFPGSTKYITSHKLAKNHVRGFDSNSVAIFGNEGEFESLAANNWLVDFVNDSFDQVLMIFLAKIVDIP